VTAAVVDHATPPAPGALPAAPLPLASDRPVPRPLLWGIFAVIVGLYALLWTPYWYPLSDSSLYLVMARALAQGRGIGFMRVIHRDVRPLTPMMLYGVIKCGGGIGAMQAVESALTLLAHVLAFLTLRRWFNERVALMGTVATAMSWWVYANAFTIMTEPMFLAMFWGALLALSGIPRTTSLGRQWASVVIGALLCVGAFENRIAALLLIPGTILGLWMQNRRDVGWRTRTGWVLVFVVFFGAALFEWKRPFMKRVNVTPTGMPSEGGGGLLVDPGESGPATEVYHLTALVNVTNPLVQLPVSAGRWLAEGLAMPAAALFDAKQKLAVQITAGLFVFGLFLVTCAGWFRMIRGGHWYAVGLASYFFPYWIMWGNRLKPRYMAPILPLIFIQLWAGTAMLLWAIRKWRGADLEPLQWRRTATAVGGVLLTSVVVVNLVPYGVDVYVRHFSRLNFYDVARRGAFAELVDIGAYLQKNTPQDAQVFMNYGPNRRVLGFLSDRDLHLPTPSRKRGSSDIPIKSPTDHPDLTNYFNNISRTDPRAEWAVVYYNNKAWPSYHLPLAKDGRTASTPPRWWQLFRREKGTTRWLPVAVPVDRQSVRSIPGVHDRVVETPVGNGDRRSATTTRTSGRGSGRRR
jgi:hypothetical protein